MIRHLADRAGSLRRVASANVVVVGAGPCGLACARELLQLDHPDVVVLEQADHAGGLAASITDPQGFTWDRGGHVVFSHYGEFDELLRTTMGDDVERHERSSYVRVAGTWVPYPFQNNLHHLPTELAEEAIVGLILAQQQPTAGDGPADFETWMLGQFGSGICRQFMQPYNEKVWAHPASMMSSGWIAERVATVDWRRAVHHLVHRTDDVGWGPNDRFAFPTAGGTGEIYRRLAATLGDLVHFGAGVRSIDTTRRTITTDTSEYEYDHLVWTGALDLLVGLIDEVPAEVRRAAGELVHNSVTVVGIGYEAPVRDDRSWLYLPEPDVPFYRATNFAKYAAANVPGSRTDRYSSWMTEIASSPYRPLPDGDLGAQVDDALRRLDLVEPSATVASVHIDHVERAYPVPTMGRDAALRTIHPWLHEHQIMSRGRFGAWRYELGNMDHAVKMGIDVARRLAVGDAEVAWRS